MKKIIFYLYSNRSRESRCRDVSMLDRTMKVLNCDLFLYFFETFKIIF